MSERGNDGGAPDVQQVRGRERLDDAIQSYPVVVVEFLAEWCDRCETLEPTLETVAAETSATVLQVDVEASPSAARTFDVNEVPTLFVLVDGDPVEKLTGLQEEASLRAVVEDHG